MLITFKEKILIDLWKKPIFLFLNRQLKTNQNKAANCAVHASNFPLPPQVLLYQLWKSGIYFLPFKKKIPSVKQWVIMLGEYIQLDEKKLIKKSKRK